ncbi:MAG: hypothetical protein OXN94_12030 [Chloroflexota bacterium]|nr:hypothetical protein [Chloroflexota bacterium]
MTVIVAFIDQVAVGIYFLIAAGILFALRRYFVWGDEYRSSYFELERDLSRYRQTNAITAVVVLLELALIVAGIQLIVVPELWRDRQIQELVAAARVDDGVFQTPLPPTPSGNLGIDPVALPRAEDFTGRVQPTPVPTPTPVGTLIPADPPIGCDSPEAQLIIPGNGMRVFQPIPVVGTVFTDQFAFGSIEIMGPSTFGNFQVIEDQNTEVREAAEFSQFVPAAYEPGEYQFRLMVFDVTKTLRASCLVHIYISEPLPTVTPPR